MEDFQDKKTVIYTTHIMASERTGPSCSKLTMSLVNVSLKV